MFILSQLLSTISFLSHILVPLKRNLVYRELRGQHYSVFQLLPLVFRVKALLFWFTLIFHHFLPKYLKDPHYFT